MEREIIFKAKRKLNGKWVKGSLVKSDTEDWDFIIQDFDDPGGTPIDSFAIRVISNTICQYTGLNDVNGNKIFEGDRFGEILFAGDYNYYESTGYIAYKRGAFIGIAEKGVSYQSLSNFLHECELTGKNIHDA